MHIYHLGRAIHRMPSNFFIDKTAKGTLGYFPTKGYFSNFNNRELSISPGAVNRFLCINFFQFPDPNKAKKTGITL